MAVVVKTVLGSHFGVGAPMEPFWLVGEFTTHFRAYSSGDCDVHKNGRKPTMLQELRRRISAICGKGLVMACPFTFIYPGLFCWCPAWAAAMSGVCPRLSTRSRSAPARVKRVEG